MPRQIPNRKGNESVPAQATDAAPTQAITWKEPGPSLRGQGLRAAPGKWVELLKPLLAHPGRWAVVYTAEGEGKLSQKASGQAAALRSEKTRKPAGKWEFTSRQGEVFARYIGPE